MTNVSLAIDDIIAAFSNLKVALAQPQQMASNEPVMLHPADPADQPAVEVVAPNPDDVSYAELSGAAQTLFNTLGRQALVDCLTTLNAKSLKDLREQDYPQALAAINLAREAA
jgi:hypothetical protein